MYEPVTVTYHSRYQHIDEVAYTVQGRHAEAVLRVPTAELMLDDGFMHITASKSAYVGFSI